MDDTYSLCLTMRLTLAAKIRAELRRSDIEKRAAEIEVPLEELRIQANESYQRRIDGIVVYPATFLEKVGLLVGLSLSDLIDQVQSHSCDCHYCTP